jgi:RNA polymerase sigma factor (TIGR02999 family)
VALHSDSSNQVTELLARWSEGDAAAREALVPVVYNELRRVAGRCLAGQHNQTLQSTALVHEAYLRLVGQDTLRVENRAHFFGIAGLLMRQILVDHARKRGAAKSGDGKLWFMSPDGKQPSDVPFASERRKIGNLLAAAGLNFVITHASPFAQAHHR